MKITHTVDFFAGPLGIYFDRLMPAIGSNCRRETVLMIHGGSHNGSCYLRTANGTPGWAYDFAQRGYQVVAIDWPGHGRSGCVDLKTLTGNQVCDALASLIRGLADRIVLLTHSMGSAFGWRLAELCRNQIAAVVAAAPAPPGNIQPEPEIVFEDAERLILQTPFRQLILPNEPAIRPDEQFVRDKLIGNSRKFPLNEIDRYSKSLGYTGWRLLYERLNVRCSQVRVENTDLLAKMPVMVLTGSEDLEHPLHVDKHLTEWLVSCGALGDFVWLADKGISGNGHMLMMEENSDATAALILEWLDRNI
ncbi:alpha/beta fold hydrolase [Granulicella sp. L60]|uniref:alpha/beta fold hydrolase n=1 Tax=Granulicella sp. L60 TaxID=1641866 RepID=UPI00131AED4D|nr:alpha/beta fold hydrolase [Granulicella sp. L60]